jgi:hypothetical protein
VIQADVAGRDIVELLLGEIGLKSKPMALSQKTRSLSKSAPLFSSISPCGKPSLPMSSTAVLAF